MPSVACGVRVTNLNPADTIGASAWLVETGGHRILLGLLDRLLLLDLGELRCVLVGLLLCNAVDLCIGRLLLACLFEALLFRPGLRQRVGLLLRLLRRSCLSSNAI